MNIKWEWTVPNMLSLVRILLVPVFAVLYLMSDQHPVLLYWAIAVLIVSGVTDLFDGWIARKFNQVSEIGKVLDPVADKFTQVTVVLCLAIRMPRLWPLLAICAVKEILQSIGATLLMIRRKVKAEPARWYGKVSTFAFYLAMGMFVLCPPGNEPPPIVPWNMPYWLASVLAGVVAGCMAYAFYQYARLYIQISREIKAEKQAAAQTDDASA